MSNLTINPQWHDAINQVETDEFITGGADGNANLATRQLAENLFWLKDYVMGLPTTPTPSPKPTPSPIPTNNTGDGDWQHFALDNLRITALPPVDGLDYLTQFKFETLPAISGTLAFDYRMQNMTVTNFDDPNFKTATSGVGDGGTVDAYVTITNGVGVYDFSSHISRPDTTGCPYLYILAWKNYVNGMVRFPAALFDVTKSADTAFLGIGETNNTPAPSGWMIESA